MPVMVKSRFCRISGHGLGVFGVILLVVSVLGDTTELGAYESRRPRSWERFDPVLVTRTPSLDSLLEEFRWRNEGNPDTDPERSMRLLFNIVSERFSQGSAHHNAFSNWLLWSLGLLEPAMSHVRDPDSLLSRGHSGLCDQVSFVLLNLASDVGIPARHVGLNGHVVMEAWYERRLAPVRS